VKYVVSATGTSTVGTAFATLGSGNVEYIGVSPGQQLVVQPTAAALTVSLTEIE
jgi:hypothetical protein